MLRIIFMFATVIASNGLSQVPGKSLQNIQVDKTKTGRDLIIKPNTGHHFNLEAPTRVKKNGQDVKPLTMTPTALTISLKDDEKCDLQIQTYVCDDKKTFCAPQNENLTCANLLKSVPASDLKESKPSVNPKKSETDKKKVEKPEIFIVNDPQMAIAQAKKQGKPLFIDFFGTWCPPCNVLDETVFNSSAFKSRAKDFILLKLDADDKVSWDLKSNFEVKGYPTVVLATVDNEEITRFQGTIPEAQILKMMTYAQKNKSISLNKKREQFKAHPKPELALEIIDNILGNENYEAALAYIPIAMQGKNLTLADKEKMLLIPLRANAKQETSASAKINMPLYKSLLEDYPITDLYFQKITLIQDAAQTLNDSQVIKWVNETNVKKLHATLAKPKLELSNLTKLDLMFLLADSYEKLDQKENEKKIQADIVSEYDRLIKNYNQNPETNRGYNLDRIYSLYKSGKIEQARTEYEKIISIYPNEFTFHYNYASVLKDLKEWDKALPAAKKALEFSYGDNQLRAIYMVSEIESQKGLKKESIARLTKAIETTELPKDETVRTHRYVKRLAELRKKIQDGNVTN